MRTKIKDNSNWNNIQVSMMGIIIDTKPMIYKPNKSAKKLKK